MVSKMESWRSFPVASSELRLEAVLPTGQSFRWREDESSPGEWIGVFAHHVWRLKQSPGILFYQMLDNPSIASKEAETLLQSYFQLDVSLSKLYKEWGVADPKFLSLTSLSQCKGVRLLRQNPVETTFAFICSANNNIPRITSLVGKLCSIYGEKLTSVQGQPYFDFPPLERLTGVEVEKRLRSEGFGYRAPYITASAARLLDNGGEEWLDGLKSGGYDLAHKELQTLTGVGRKVADCICLMALGYSETIPIDTHIHQLGKERLPHLATRKTLTDKTYSEISGYFQGIYGPYAGWAQAVLFASRISPHKGKQLTKGQVETQPKPKRRKLT